MADDNNRTTFVPAPPRSPERRCGSCGGSLPDRGSLNGTCPACMARSLTFALTDEDDDGDEVIGMFEAVTPSVPGYQLGPLAGSGGLGLVFRATRESDGTTVAVKMLSRRWCEDHEQIARFEREGRVLSKLNDPNIVRFIESGKTTDGHLYLATEFVEGMDLRRRLVQQPLPVNEALDIFARICAAVEHAHAMEVVHRDLKPSNVLLGNDGSVKVADFGIAKPARAGSAAVSLTQSNSTIGTPYYMAPESIRSLSAANARSDIYSLGVILYELLTGSLPMGSFTPASKKKPGIDPRFDAIIEKALAEDPAQRFASVKAFREAVQGIASPRPPRIWLRAAVVAAVVAICAAAFAWHQQDQELRKQHPEHSATRERPYVNDLGMKFAPLPGHSILMSLWETRIRDFDVFATETGIAPPAPSTDGFSVMEFSFREADDDSTAAQKSGQKKGKGKAAERPLFPHAMMVPSRNGWMENGAATWKNPGWPVTPDHPVCGVTYDEATTFCAWLTTREQAAGRISRAHKYRLPTSEEWQDAASRKGTTPDGAAAEFVWGDAWPPPRGAGNLTGREVTEPPWPGWATLDYEDGYPRTAPVGKFEPSARGYYDMEGNIKEWCAPLPGGDKSKLIPLRGAAWGTVSDRKLFGLRYLSLANPAERHSLHGFRIVLEHPQAKAGK